MQISSEDSFSAWNMWITKQASSSDSHTRRRSAGEDAVQHSNWFSETWRPQCIIWFFTPGAAGATRTLSHKWSEVSCMFNTAGRSRSTEHQQQTTRWVCSWNEHVRLLLLRKWAFLLLLLTDSYRSCGDQDINPWSVLLRFRQLRMKPHCKSARRIQLLQLNEASWVM